MLPSTSSPTVSDRSTSALNHLRIGMAGEWALLRRGTVISAVLALIFVPSLYVLIYVSSVWDPYSALPQLPAALVNLDVPVKVAGKNLKVGDMIVDTLQRQRPFGFLPYDNAEAARAAVRSGAVFFAVTIPADFSQRAVAPNESRNAQLDIYVSEGGNFMASIVSKRFAAELAHTVNETLNHERWALLVGEKGGTGETTLREGLQALRDGGNQLAAGTAQLEAGSVRLREGVGRAGTGANQIADGTAQIAAESPRLSGGMKQVAEAVATMRKKLPDDAQLGALAQGSKVLAQGTGELRQGLSELQAGVPRLQAGVAQLQEGSAKVPLVGGKIAAGAGQLKDGVATFGEGISRASAGAIKLSDGMYQLDAAIQPLAVGLIQLNSGLRTMGEQLPSAEKLDLFDRSMIQLRDGTHELTTRFGEIDQGAAQVQAGAKEVETGAATMAAGLDRVVTQFDAGFAGRDPAHLAAPVEAVVEITSPVPNNGAAFAPYFSALSLWVGALMMSFVFYLRRLPDSLKPASRPVKWLAKASLLLVLGVLQATVVVASLVMVMSIHLVHPALVWLVAALGSMTFVCVVVLLLVILGDAGRLLTLVLLIFQLAASGGIYPIQLSPQIFQHVHPYLPLTLLVHCFRATMFDALDGHWTHPATELILVALGAMVLGVLFARWKYVARESYGPAVEF